MTDTNDAPLPPEEEPGADQSDDPQQLLHTPWLAMVSEKLGIVVGIAFIVGIFCCCGGLVLNYLIAL
jgi:hypothetical protein